jgi:hypothetical protein
MDYDCKVIKIELTPSKIDELCEKFIHGFLRNGKMVEVFQNPSKRDIKNARNAEGSYSKNLRFIADGNTKKIYAWNAALCLHSEMLSVLKEEGFISRSVQLYNDPDVTSGEWNDKDGIELYYNVQWGPEEMGNVILDGDWSWVDKTGFKMFQQKLMLTVAKELGDRADPRILKAAGL